MTTVPTIVVNNEICLDLIDLLQSGCGESRPRLRGSPGREVALNLGNFCACLRTKELIYVRICDGVRRSFPAHIETISAGAEGIRSLLLQVLADRLEINLSGDAEWSQDARIADAGELE